MVRAALLMNLFGQSRRSGWEHFLTAAPHEAERMPCPPELESSSCTEHPVSMALCDDLQWDQVQKCGAITPSHIGT